MQAFQAAMVKVFQALIPDHLAPFIDDLPLKPKHRKKEETIVSPGIRKFVHDFVLVLEEFFTIVQDSGLKLSPSKSSVAVLSITLVGHLVSVEGRQPSERNRLKALNWRQFQILKDVRGFVNCIGFFRNWIQTSPLLLHLCMR